MSKLSNIHLSVEQQGVRVKSGPPSHYDKLVKTLHECREFINEVKGDGSFVIFSSSMNHPDDYTDSNTVIEIIDILQTTGVKP